MKLLDFILIGLVLLWLVAVCIFLRKRKKSGKCVGCSGCDGNCSGCNATNFTGNNFTGNKKIFLDK